MSHKTHQRVWLLFRFGHIAQIIANRLYFGSFYELPKNDEETIHFRIDEHINYHPFYDGLSFFLPFDCNCLFRFRTPELG